MYKKGDYVVKIPESVCEMVHLMEHGNPDYSTAWGFRNRYLL